MYPLKTYFCNLEKPIVYPILSNDLSIHIRCFNLLYPLISSSFSCWVSDSILGCSSLSRLLLHRTCSSTGQATCFYSTAGPRASRAGSGPPGGGGGGGGAGRSGPVGVGSGPVGVVAADAADAAGHRRRRRIFKRITNKDI